MQEYEIYQKYVLEKITLYASLIEQIIFDNNNDYLKIQEDLMELLKDKDPNLVIHCNNVKLYSSKLLSKLTLDDKHKNVILKAAQIHDLGKLVIPDEILFNTDEFTKEEYSIMKMHTNALQYLLINPIFKEILPIALSHHERLDGSGYPQGLAEVPKGSQIISIADSYDAMTSKRTYNNPLTKEESLKILTDKSFVKRKRFITYQKQIQQFDSNLVKKFVKAMNE